jgi:hypothetical protein
MNKMKNRIIIAAMFLPCLLGGAFAMGSGGSGSVSNTPAYYSLEDLRSGLANQQWFFENTNKPPMAKVDLGSQPLYPASSQKRAGTTATVNANPAKYRVKASRTVCNWVDLAVLDFDWDGFRRAGGQRGDLAFLRANGTGPDLVKIFSNWTHVAMVDDPSSKYVFESTVGGSGGIPSGVSSNFAPTSWGKVNYYTCKRIQTITNGRVCALIDAAKRKWTKLPYFPQVSTATDLMTFLYRWSDKNDLSSMYCGKLVYNTFKSDINFDTNNTCTFSSQLQETSGADLFSWIGVAPDDIYYASDLGADFNYSTNLTKL